MHILAQKRTHTRVQLKINPMGMILVRVLPGASAPVLHVGLFGKTEEKSSIKKHPDTCSLENSTGLITELEPRRCLHDSCGFHAASLVFRLWGSVGFEMTLIFSFQRVSVEAGRRRSLGSVYPFVCQAGQCLGRGGAYCPPPPPPPRTKHQGVLAGRFPTLVTPS